MKVTLATHDIQQKLSFANHAISVRNPLPVLMHFLLTSEAGKLMIQSTDLEIGIQTSVKGEIAEEGNTTVPARTFSELINSLTEDTITLETQDTSLMVISKHTRSVFQTMPTDDFPKLYEEKGTLVAKLSAKALKKDFSCVIFASSSDTTRPALSGVLIKKENSGFLLVATDGYRLSLKHSKTAPLQKTGLDLSMIVPARAFREIISAKEEAEDVALYIAKEKNQVLFTLGETMLIGRLIEAEFPNYERIIPTDHSVKATFDREELLKAVRICSIFARDGANIIKFSLQKNRIVVSSQTPSVGENTVDVDAKVTGEENEIAFNARYLLDVLSNLTEEELTFEMTGPLNPGVFRIKDDDSFLHLIMPIRIQQ